LCAGLEVPSLTVFCYFFCNFLFPFIVEYNWTVIIAEIDKELMHADKKELQKIVVDKLGY